ncbi:MAG TPA: alpha/beta hydrolase domain-containing protein [Rhizomicrobium sp.]
MRSIICASAAVFALTGEAVVPTPTVIGPLPSETPGTPGHNYPFFATDMVLSDFGFIEQEFFFDGTANRYDAPAPSGGVGNNAASATTANIVATGIPYRSRMLVRRPADASRFNGVVVVEWLNVTNGYDTDVHWLYQKEFFLRAGYAWVGVSAQNAGLSNQPNGLKNWSPTRYGTLNVNANGTLTGDVLSYDIYSQAAQAIKSVPIVMGGLPVQMMIAIGQSQSAGRLGIYLNAIHLRDPIYDGAVLASGGQIIRNDLSVPVIKLLTETEFAMNSTNEIPVLQPDTDKIRIWPVAGSSHSEQYSLLSRAAFLKRDLNLQAIDTCATPARSRVPNRFVYNAAVDAIVQVNRSGKAPPHAPPVEVLTVSPPSIARDQFGNGLGGIRLAEMEVPVAHEGGETCGLGGTHVPFTTAMLDALYPNHGTYVSQVAHAANASVEAGFVLPEDAQATIEKAAGSIFGGGLVCGALCEDSRQFPIHPSSMLLRDQTSFFAFVGNEALVATLEDVTRDIAKGYTYGGKKSAQSFANAVAGLQTYISQVQQVFAAGHLRPETAQLLTDQANTLIQSIQAL